MTTVALVQARTGSQRLPGKVLMDLAGSPLVAHSLRALRAAKRVDEVVLATTTHEHDDPLEELARTERVGCHRGSDQDVLGRLCAAAADRDADVVVRLTGDCPLLDPEVVDQVVATLVDAPEPCDYASNVLRRTYPKGLDTEAMWMDTLRRVERLARSAEAREHVTWFIYRERPELFLLRSVELDEDHSDVDWSVDTAEDLERVRELVARVGIDERPIPWRTALKHRIT